MKLITTLTFFKLHLERIPRFRSQKFTYVAIGDSATEGIGASRPERSYTGVLYTTIKSLQRNTAYYNFGKSGAPAEEILATQLDKAIALQPQLITISVGANDLRIKTRPTIFKKRLYLMIQRIKTETNAQIVINTIPDFSLTPRIPSYLKHVSRIAIKHYNKIISKAAKAENIICVDLFDHGAYFTKHYPEAISADGFHPSDFGYALWANEMLSQIKHLFIPQRLTKFS